MASAKSFKQKFGERYYAKDLDYIYEDLRTDPKQGLKKTIRESRLSYLGHNELPKAGKSLFKIYLAPIFNYFILILIVSAIIVTILAAWQTAIVTYIVVISNSIVLT